MHKQTQQALDTRINFITNGVVERMEQYALGVSSLNSAISANNQVVDYRFMKSFSDSQNYPVMYEGARGFGVIKPVLVDEESTFIALAKEEREDHTFAISTLSPHKKTRYIIQYIFPENINKQAIGLDIGSEKNRRSTAVKAALSNEISLTAPITLVQASGNIEHGFLLLQPIYKNGYKALTEQDIPTALYGWAYSPLLIGEILTTVTQIGEDKLTITDLDEKRPFYNNQPEHSNVEHFIEKQIAIFGREWSIRLYATPHFVGSLNLPNKYLGFIQGGLITVIALLGYSLIVVSIKRKAQMAQHQIELAKIREDELSRSNSKLSTEVEEKDTQLQRLNVLNDSILKSAAYAVIATNKEGIIKSFNPAAEKLLGYKAIELIDKQSPAIFHLESEVVEKAKKLTQELHEVVQPGFDVFVIKAKRLGIDSNQWTYVSKDGKHVQVQLSVTALVDEESHPLGYLGIAYDLTESLKHEQELKIAKETAENASQTKSDFLANMSHEIRTPMNAILGGLQLLRRAQLTPDLKQVLNNASFSAQSLLTIINDILDYSKIESNSLELEHIQFSLTEVLESVKYDLDAIVSSKRIDLQIEKGKGFVDYWLGDLVRVKQIMLNLASNAVKFTDVGCVKINVGIQSDDSTSGIQFEVIDSGIGMSDEAVSKIFERFTQADTSTTRKYGGTGLGMSITLSLIKMMGGDINVKSKEGEGTKVKVTLPLEPVNMLQKSKTQKSLSAPNLASKKILIAEDNAINKVLIESMLKATKAMITIVENGQLAVEAFSSDNFDLVLMDIHMPVMDGVEAQQHISKINSNIPVIALTANVMRQDVDSYLAQGFVSHVAKPIDINDLYGILKNFLST